MDNETILYGIGGTITGGALFFWLKNDYYKAKDINTISNFVINNPVKAYGVRQAYYKKCNELKPSGLFSYFAIKNLKNCLEDLKNTDPKDLEDLVDKFDN